MPGGATAGSISAAGGAPVPVSTGRFIPSAAAKAAAAFFPRGFLGDELKTPHSMEHEFMSH